MADTEVRAALRDEAKRIEEDCQYSSQRHYETASYWGHWSDRLGVGATVLAAAAATTAFTQLMGGTPVAAAASLLAATLSAIQQFFKPDRRMQLHRAAGDAYLALEGRARRFRTIGLVDDTLLDNRARAELEAIASDRDKANASSPLTPHWAFEKARKNIEAGQTRHVVDRARSGPSGTDMS